VKHDLKRDEVNCTEAPAALCTVASSEGNGLFASCVTPIRDGTSDPAEHICSSLPFVAPDLQRPALPLEMEEVQLDSCA
jgi:hypothetical protein